MGTWLGCIVETRGRADFWDLARAENVQPKVAEVPAMARIDVVNFWDGEAPFALAEALSKKLGGAAVGFLGQSNSDVYEVRAYQAGSCVRRLAYSRDDDGWLTLEGKQQPWEARFFFAGGDGRDSWPDMLSDEVDDEALARYRAAREAGDASSVMDLLEPSSLECLYRLAVALGVSGEAPPDGVLEKRKGSLLGKLFGRR